MPASPEANTPGASLPPYLAALWGMEPRLAPMQPSPNEADVPPRPILSGIDPRVLHLPLHATFAQEDAWRQAAASHAAAHWRFGGPPIPRGKLKPVQQALLGVLEDARVEWLALQALPGLRGLWLPFHEGSGAAQGSGFDALLGRLARTLLDPAHIDPHPWVAKARAVFFEADGQTPALHTPEAVRQAASLLGADIGQMRLPFNVRTYRVHAAYRDDNSHLWQADDDLPPSDTPLEGGQGASAQPDDAAGAPMVLPASPSPRDSGPPQEAEAPVAVYPEWDRVIGRYRPAWCQVFSPRLAETTAASSVPVTPSRLVQALAGLQGAAMLTGSRAREGDELHFGALVETRIARHLRQPPDPRIYRRVSRPAPPLAVLLLLDASASTAHRGPDADAPLLDEIRHAALGAGTALQTLGHRAALWAFASNGRQSIDMPCLKHWDEPVHAPAVARRMAALHSAGSTRLGAVLRHAMAVCAADAVRCPGWHRVIVFVTDGEPHDIDVPNPTYLGADLRRAAMEARQRGMVVRALVLPPGKPEALARLLGPGSCAPLPCASDLARRLPGLLAGLG
ncbi:hypothetical protein RD110_00840 [Rhodoferax koreense]|uniref:VWFA domain-containing protein n=1 Tax=Rhodoferax koreensis TaxID=1842727 RepID=A0A1P8K2Y9_9BURK|nr:hypothetical protein [Rhodoferax koreense]APW40385.1 hypothetical protein RD110_00840 [Rhodoferax koreense]